MASCEQCQGEDGKEHPSAGPELLTCLPTWGREGGRNSWGVLGGVFPNPLSLHSTATSSAKPEGADPDYPSSPVPPFFLIWNILNSLESDQKCSPAPTASPGDRRPAALLFPQLRAGQDSSYRAHAPQPQPVTPGGPPFTGTESEWTGEEAPQAGVAPIRAQLWGACRMPGPFHVLPLHWLDPPRPGPRDGHSWFLIY